MTDNRTNEPTEAQIEAAAKAIYSVQRPGWAWHENQQHRWHRKLARAALVAAQGAAPQAVKDVHEPSHDRVYCVRCGGNWPCQPAPVLPSSDVDEDALAKAWHEGFCRGEASGAREVPMNPDEWNPYRGKGGESRGE